MRSNRLHKFDQRALEDTVANGDRPRTLNVTAPVGASIPCDHLRLHFPFLFLEHTGCNADANLRVVLIEWG
jgi:hypothetical protein